MTQDHSVAAQKRGDLNQMIENCSGRERAARLGSTDIKGFSEEAWPPLSP